MLQCSSVGLLMETIAIARAMEHVEDVLAEGQWDMVPAALKNPVRRGMR